MRKRNEYESCVPTLTLIRVCVGQEESNLKQNSAFSSRTPSAYNLFFRQIIAGT